MLTMPQTSLLDLNVLMNFILSLHPSISYYYFFNFISLNIITCIKLGKQLTITEEKSEAESLYAVQLPEPNPPCYILIHSYC